MLPGAACFLIPSVERLKLLSPALKEARALVRAHERPISVLLHSLHEEVGDPERVEEVSRPILLCAIIFAELKELVNVGMPWLKVDSEGALALATTLIHIACCVVKHLQHWHETI